MKKLKNILGNENIDKTLNEVVKIKLSNFFNKDNELIPCVLEDKNLEKAKTLIKESEIIRIVKKLNSSNALISDSGYCYVKDILNININNDIKLYENTDGIINFNGIWYKRLLASAGHIRSKKAIYVNEELYDMVNEILLCGMPEDMEYDILAKFNAYYALASTDSTPVTLPRMVVVDDYKKNIEEYFDCVEEVGKDKYIVKNNIKRKPVDDIKPFDGGGLCSIKWASKVAFSKLELNYLPSAFQFRAIPGIKGNLYVFDIGKFAKENSKTIIKDVWGKEHNIFDKKGNLIIDVILTKSQFKFKNEYNSYDEWLSIFKKPIYNYRRTFNISNVSSAYGNIKHNTILSYQPLQTLKLNNMQIKLLCNDTIKIIKDISSNTDEFLKFRGLIDDGDNNMFIPEYYKALKINKELFNDEYIHGKIQNDIRGYKNRALKGDILINGANYQTLIPDLVALAEWAFGIKEPKGCLAANEIYSKYWVKHKVKELDIVRFPHISNEHCVVKVINPNNDYLKYTNEGIVTSIYDSIALKLNSADFDGDKVVGISNKIIVAVAKKQRCNTIIYIPKEIQKEVPEADANKAEKNRINNIKKIIKTDVTGMKTNIGKVINQISKLWAIQDDEKVNDYIKIMSIVGSLTIDFVKTGVASKIPTEIKKFLDNKKMKKPMFMQYIYPKEKLTENRINKYKALSDGGSNNESVSLFYNEDCTMNRLSNYIKEQTKDIKLKKLKSEFYVENLLKNKDFNIKNNTYPLILKLLSELKYEHDRLTQEFSMEKDIDFINNTKVKQEKNYKYKLFYTLAKNKLLLLCNDKNKLVDYAVYVFYLDKKFVIKNPDKSLLWNIFGSELNSRLKTKGNTNFKVADSEVLQKNIIKIREKIKKYKGDKKSISIQSVDFKQTAFINNKDIAYVKQFYHDAKKFNFVSLFLILSKMYAANSKDKIKICSSKNELSRNKICNLININFKQYDKLFEELINEKIIVIESVKDYVLCSFNFKEDGESKCFEINDLNQINKYIKSLRKII